MLPYLKKFCCQGFNLLAFDARGHGNSDPDKYSNLVKFAEDMMACIDFVENNRKSSNPDFYLVGLSIGGAGSIYAAAHDKRIKKVVTVGAFAHPASVMKKQFKDHRIPYYPMIWLMFRYLRIFQKLDLDKIAPEKHIANANASFLLIHGAEDVTVPVEEGKRLAKAAGDHAELWIIPHRGHSDCHLEKGFWEKVIEFMKR
jgi:pimeloyl-ACP methyl ester carboxylesterase